MIFVLCGLVAVIAVLLLLLYFSIRKNLEFEERFEEMGVQTEESLDILNDCFQRISKVAEMPVGSDDPVIQQLLADIQYTKQAILLVANKVVTFDRDEDEEK